MSQRVLDEAGRLAWSVLAALAFAMVLMPACVAVAQAQDGGADVASALGIAGPIAWPVGLAFATEFLRSIVPAWQRGVRADANALAAVDHFRSLPGADPVHVETLRKLAAATGGPSDLAKTGLRIVPVAAGVIFGLLGATPAIGGGAYAEVFGGALAGFVASLFGGSIMKKARDKFGEGKRARDDEAAP